MARSKYLPPAAERDDPLNPGKKMPAGKYRDGEGRATTIDQDPTISKPRSAETPSVGGTVDKIKARETELQKFAKGGQVLAKPKNMGKCC